jgi:hypothetical protein
MIKAFTVSCFNLFFSSDQQEWIKENVHLPREVQVKIAPNGLCSVHLHILSCDNLTHHSIGTTDR